LEMEKKARGEQPLTLEREILRVNPRKDSIEPSKDEVIVEDRIELYINNEHYAVFSFSPSQIKELVVGHLLTEGIIDKPEEVQSLETSKGRAYVQLSKKAKLRRSEKPRIILTECGNGVGKIPPDLWMKTGIFKNSPSVRLNSQTILKAVETLNSQACMYRKTGGTHASALLDENGKVLAFSEDIGRHNAIDKVVGKAALEGSDFKRTLLASTGRLTSEMVMKAARVGIPVVVSISAPTDKGIKIAEMVGLTLVGFARGGRFNIYTYSGRIRKNLKNV